MGLLDSTVALHATEGTGVVGWLGISNCSCERRKSAAVGGVDERHRSRKHGLVRERDVFGAVIEER